MTTLSHQLRVIRALMRADLKIQLTYRFNFFLEFIGTILSFVVLIFLWRNLFEQRTIIGAYTQHEMMTYLLGGALIAPLVFQVNQGDTINRHIKLGRLDTHLVRPMDLRTFWLTIDFNQRLHNFLIMTPVIALLFLTLSTEIVGPASSAALGLTALAIILGALINYYLFNLVALWAFWADETWGPRFILRVIAEIASGKLLPLHLLPTALAAGFMYLPFAAMLYVPLQIYLGKLTSSEIIQAFSVELIWLGLTSLSFELMLRRGLAKYSAVGG
jgi:ABC-2 type transport system permease protein